MILKKLLRRGDFTLDEKSTPAAGMGVVAPPLPTEDAKETGEDGPENRGHWGSRAEFVLSCIGMSVGLGNIWRFPYLAYKNGGAAFLIPYVILLILVGKPLYLVEITLGQFSSRSSLAVWRCVPIAKGVGVAMMVICGILSIYYNIIIAYTIFYMASSFGKTLPWEDCNSWWGADERCYVRKAGMLPTCKDLRVATNFTADANITDGVTCHEVNFTRQSAAEQYWEKYVLHLNEADGIDDIGEVRWELALCLLLAWIIVFLCLCKGIRSSGKVVYFTATFPYLILLILMIKGVTLDGAILGLKYLFIPDWSRLADITVWKAAAEQMFFSLGVSFGSLIMFGSYNQFKHRTHIDAMAISIVDFVSSLIGCIAIFSILGHLATTLEVDVKDVAVGGQGLAFVTYPEAIALLPIPQLWSVLFFFMLFTLGLDSEFATLESILSNLNDEIPKLRKYKVWVTLAICVICFLLGLPIVTNGGQYILDLMDTFGAGTSILVVAFFETIAIMWIYGVNRYSNDMEFMLGFKPNWYWKVCWAFICPVFLGVIMIISFSFYSPPKYGDYPYPDWAQHLGWMMTMLSIIQIPIWGAVVAFNCWRNGDIGAAFRPTKDWGPADPHTKLDWDEQNILNYSTPDIMSRSYENGLDNPALSHSLSSLDHVHKKNLAFTSVF